jgi:hypothetical protein
MVRGPGLVLAVVIAGAVGCASVAAAMPIELASHRAVYKMGLATARSGSGMANASGTWTYQFTDVCKAWVTEFRLVITYAYAEGGQVETTTDFLGWESKDGLVYRFRVRQARDGQVTDDVEGVARLAGVGKGGTVRYSRPEVRSIRLPRGTVFPTTHTVRLIEAAQGGGQSLARPLFDGQGEEGPFETNARIGRLQSQIGGGADPLLNSPAWPIRLAFFPIGSLDPLPEFEVALTYHANGVAEGIEQIFKTFSLRGKLDTIEALPGPRC